MEANEIMQQVRARYTSCTSYRDRGRGWLCWFLPYYVWFRTEFRSPVDLTFRCKILMILLPVPGASKCDAQRNMAYFFGWAEMPGPDHAIGSLTGVSAGASFYVPSVLMNQFPKSNLFGIKHPKLLRRATLDGTECLVVAGYVNDSYRELWIDSNDFSIRKVGTLFDPFLKAAVIAQPLEESESKLLRFMMRVFGSWTIYDEVSFDVP
jgi:hypothetical protein